MSTQTRQPQGTPTGGQFAATTRSEAAVALVEPEQQESVQDALAATLTMNRAEAERHVKSLLDEAAKNGDPQRIEQIASAASGAGWRGTAYVRNYPGAGNPECDPTRFLPTKAAATRTAEHAWSALIAAERNAAQAKTTRQETS